MNVDFSNIRELIKEDRYYKAIESLKVMMVDYPDSVDVLLALIYCYGIIQAEFGMDEKESETILKESSNLFERAYNQFKSDPVFLYYAGFMICLGEWWYGVEDGFGEKMMDQAYQMEPGNIVYQWAPLGKLTGESRSYKKKRDYYSRLLDYVDKNGISFITDHGPMGDYYADCFVYRFIPFRERIRYFESLQGVIDSGNTIEAINSLKEKRIEFPDELDIILALICCFGLYLKNQKSTSDTYKDLLNQSAILFNESFSSFQNNSYFLFYAGFMINGNEMLFGREPGLGKNMMHKAHMMMPKDIIYQSALYQDGNNEGSVEKYQDDLLLYFSRNGATILTDHGPMGVYYYRCCIEPYMKNRT